jgi:hypothetical protein
MSKGFANDMASFMRYRRAMAKLLTTRTTTSTRTTIRGRRRAG